MSLTSVNVAKLSPLTEQFVTTNEEGRIVEIHPLRLLLYAVKNEVAQTNMKKVLLFLFFFLFFTILSVVVIVIIVRYAVELDSGSSLPVLVVGAKGITSSGASQCSYIGTSIQISGGNAVDAAVATALCLGIYNPFSSGIGGSALIMVRLANGTSAVIDGRGVAPSSAYETMFTDDSISSTSGGSSVCIPGELAALERAFNKYGSGKVPWSTVVTPSSSLNSESVSPIMEQKIKESIDDLVKDPQLRGTFLKMGPDGNWTGLTTEDSLQRINLSRTLSDISKYGASYFYKGNLSRVIVDEINAAGGNVTLEDLADFYDNKVIEREPLVTFYQGYEISTASGPFGGVPLILALNILERFNIPKQGIDSQTYHWIAQALAFSFVDRLALGDPAFVDDFDEIVATLTSKQHAAKLRSRIKNHETLPVQDYEDLVPLEYLRNDAGTSSVTVVDTEGNAAVIISTINLPWGAKFQGQTTGIIYNNDMDDFAQENKTNSFGLPWSEANVIEPGKKPLSSMTPIIVTKDGALNVVLGSAGGSRMISAGLQVLLNVVAQEMRIDAAIYRPRMHYQLLPNCLYLEEGFNNEYWNALSQRGYANMTWQASSAFGEVNGITVDNGTVLGAADVRKLGAQAESVRA